MRDDPDHAILRQIRPDDILGCVDVFYDAVDPLYRRLDQPLPPRDPASLGRLIGHLLDYDADRAWLAEAPSATGDDRPPRILGFGTAWQRESTWYLALLFVRPHAQAGGLGRKLLLRTFPRGPLDLPDADGRAAGAWEAAGGTAGGAEPAGHGTADVGTGAGTSGGGTSGTTGGAGGPGSGLMATCVDSIQPISTGLYAGYGIVPRVPLFTAIGRPRPGSLPALPRDVVATGFEALPATYPLAGTLAALDRATLGFERPQDHRFWAHEGRRGVLFRRAGAGDAVGYGYAQPSGRLGPVALLDETLYPAVLGTLISRESPPGPYLALVPGVNHRAMVALLHAGLRFEGFPGIVGSTRPWEGLARYLPASYALP